MVEVPPYQKLEPNAQPWGRWVTDRTASHDNAIESLRINARSQNQSLTAQLNRLQGQVDDMRSLLAAQVLPAVNSGSASLFSLSTAEQTIVAFTLPVPEGYTRAVVTAVGSVNGLTTASGGDRLYTRCYVSGQPGPTSTTMMAVSTPWMPGTCSSSASLSAVSGSISVALTSWLQFGPGAGSLTNATLTASAIFLK